MGVLGMTNTKRIKTGTKIEYRGGVYTVTEVRGDRVLVGCVGLEFSLKALTA